jgi:hypothetical protein
MRERLNPTAKGGLAHLHLAIAKERDRLLVEPLRDVLSEIGSDRFLEFSLR